MIGLGLACSHGNGLWAPPEAWPDRVRTLSPGILEMYPAAKDGLDVEFCRAQHTRVHDAYAKLREMVTDYAPDAIIMVGDDQNDLFNMSNNPTFSIYTGEEKAWGRSPHPWDKPLAERNLVEFDNHVELSRHMLKGLIKRGFDVANLAKFEPAGRPGVGLPHMTSRVVPELDPGNTVPVINLMMNEYYPPLPTARRCIELGRAIAEVFADRPERIAICASGGLSHYPNVAAFNRGAIDVRLDTWFLEALRTNDIEGLSSLFVFDSDTLTAGTGEIRAWITAAACMNRCAEILDYMPIHASMCGVAFAAWPSQN